MHFCWHHMFWFFSWWESAVFSFIFHIWCFLFLALQKVSGCGSFWCFRPADQACFLLLSMCMVIMLCCILSLLTLPVLYLSVCEWVLWLAVFSVCWGCVIGSPGCEWLLLLHLNHTNHASSWLCSLWVTFVPCCISSLLTIPVLGSPACEWLICFAVCQACWQCLSLVLQQVSGCSALLCFKPTDNACLWLLRLWVADLLFYVSSYWECLSLALQDVSGCYALLCFKSANNACPWLFSKWVADITYCVSSYWECLSLALQKVGG